MAEPDVVIRVEQVSKRYQLGQIGRRLLFEDLNRWWARVRGRPDPTAPLGSVDHGNREGGKIWALRDVSFDVRQGDVLGIVGRNGAGKSTLLKVLSRITAPTTGTVKVRGRIGSLLEVGTGFHPELTGRENVFLNGAILGMRRAEIARQFDAIVDFSGVEEFLDTPVKRYSSGMYVRLAFSVAAHLEPEVLIVDEVLAVGDAEFQKKCLGKMGEVAGGGRTVLFVSHNLEAILRLCPRALWIDRGRVAALGPSEEVCNQYLASRTRRGAGVHDFTDGGDHAVTFSRLEMLAGDGSARGAFRADEAIRFRVVYEVKRKLSGLTVVLNITDGLGGSLWAGGELDRHPELFERVRAPGTYAVEIRAPGNVLRPGTYQVALGAASGGQYHHHPKEFPEFEVTTEGYWRQGHRFFGVGGGPIAVPMDVSEPIQVAE